MVESAAVRDISEASVYPGASLFFWGLFFVFFVTLAYVLVCRIRYSEALHQNRVLRILRHPLAR